MASTGDDVGGGDPNARLGARVEHLSGDVPPNLFLFPRSLLQLQRETRIFPFLPAYPPAFLETQQPNPLLESCAGKFFLSSAMGAFGVYDSLYMNYMWYVRSTLTDSNDDRLRHGQSLWARARQLRRHHAACAAPWPARAAESALAGIGTCC